MPLQKLIVVTIYCTCFVQIRNTLPCYVTKQSRICIKKLYNISTVVDYLVWIKSGYIWLCESTGTEIMCFDGKGWLAPALGDRG